MDQTSIESRIKRASLLIAAGLVAQVLALLRIHPLSFVGFLIIGCPLTALGILFYLMALAGQDSASLRDTAHFTSTDGKDSNASL